MFAVEGKILGKHGPVPATPRDPLPAPPPPDAGPSVAHPHLADGPPAAKVPSAADDGGLSGPPGVALVALVVRAAVLERAMGPLAAFVHRSPSDKQAAVFSRVVC